jgi:hypothetical protein
MNRNIVRVSAVINRKAPLLIITANACWHDIDAHCANSPVGGGHIAQYLLDNRKSLRAACRIAIERLLAAK